MTNNKTPDEFLAELDYGLNAVHDAVEGYREFILTERPDLMRLAMPFELRFKKRTEALRRKMGITDEAMENATSPEDLMRDLPEAIDGKVIQDNLRETFEAVVQLRHPLARRFVDTEPVVEKLPTVKPPRKHKASKKVALTPEMKKEIRKGIRNGLDNKAIAAQVGCDGRQVYAIRRFEFPETGSTLVHTDETAGFGEYR